MILIIIICFIILVSIIELIYPVKKYVDESKIIEQPELVKIEENEDNIPELKVEEGHELKEYVVYKDSTLQKKPGKIMIKTDSNVFINCDDNVIFLQKDKIYNINLDFELQIIFINEEKISYFYIDN